MSVLTVEGLLHVDDPEDTYEAADVAEYFGGEDSATAAAVVVSQLKHSTTKPGTAWTASRLCHITQRTSSLTGEPTGTARALIRDLASVWTKFAEARGRQDALRVLKVRLVSNQPADPKLARALDAAKEVIAAVQGQLQTAALLKVLAEPNRAIIETLRTSLKGHLSSGGFCDFLTVLDLSECGQQGRLSLELGVRAATVGLTPNQAGTSALQLYELIRRHALPDLAHRPGIRRSDVLAALGVPGTQSLYPAPPMLAAVDDPLPAPSAREIADAALAVPGARVLVHGGAGAGKSTTMSQLQGSLPTGSVVVVYDCFGAGGYLHSGQGRHSPRRFVTQVSNELAKTCGTSLLLDAPRYEEDLWELFARTLQQAADMLPEPGRLVLVVDAADNAATAAERKRERGFLPGLRDLGLPDRVSLILTARSHRISQLTEGTTAAVALRPFDRPLSCAHLRRYAPSATDAETELFHEATGGNPRTQFYALSVATAQGGKVPDILAECRTTPDHLFEDLVNSALQTTGTDAGGPRWLALLAALSRPVRIEPLAEALGVTTAQITAFAHGLQPGVTLEGDTIAFRDEDFESHIMGVLTPDDLREAHHRLADLFLATRSTDPDAATHVADHLFDAGREDEVIDLVLDEPAPAVISDGFDRLDIRDRRIDLALRAASNSSTGGQAVRLVMRACTATFSTTALSELLRSRPGLAARYSNRPTLARRLVRDTSQPWLGPAHLHAAAVLVHDSATHEQARDHLRNAEAWLQRRADLPPRETWGWSLKPEDLAAGAHAHHLLSGSGAAAHWLRRWSEPADLLDTVAALAYTTASSTTPRQARADLESLDIPLLYHAPFIAYLSASLDASDKTWIDACVQACLDAPAADASTWQVQLCESAAQNGDPALVRRLIEHWLRPTYDFPSEMRHSEAGTVLALRQRALLAVLDGRELDITACLPSHLRPDRKDRAGSGSHSHERQQWLDHATPLLRMCLLRARAILADGVDALPSAIAEELRRLDDSAAHRWFRGAKTYRAWTLLATEAVLASGAHTSDLGLLRELADRGPVLVHGQAPWLWLDMAAALNTHNMGQALAIDLCERAASHAQEHRHAAGNRVDLLATCAQYAGQVSPELGEMYFARAAEAAAGIDDNSARLLSAHARLAARGTLVYSEQQATDLAERLFVAGEDAADHATDEDAVPYRDMLRAAAALSPATAFATASRWDDETRHALADAVPPLLIASVATGFLTLQDASHLEHLITDPEQRIATSLTLLDALPMDAHRISLVRSELRRTARWLRSSVPAAQQPGLAHDLLDWGEANRVTDNELHAMLDPVMPFRTHDEFSQRRRQAFASRLRQAKAPSVATPAWRLLADSAFLDGLFQTYPNRQELAELIAATVHSTEPQERLRALDATVALMGKQRFDTLAVLMAVAELIREWQAWAGVRTWASEALPSILNRHLTELTHGTAPPLLLATLNAFAPTQALRGDLLAAILECRPHLTAEHMLNLALVFAELAEPHEAADSATLELRELVPAAMPPTPNSPPATTSADVIGSLLWSAFGHQRKAIRWHAAHAARGLLLDTRSPLSAALADRLATCLRSTTAGTFRSRDLHFYWLSARVWLLTVMQRVADENPAVLARHLPVIAATATDRTLPHAQIRELARTTALTIAAALPGGDTGDLAWANRPTACHAARERHRSLGDENRNRPGARYAFDATDTLPYWFTPLARVFGVDVAEVSERAERWIVDEWQLSTDDWMTDVRELRDEGTAGRMMHRHGSIPPEEGLHLYMEYHAMMLAAGELVDCGTPVTMSRHDEDDRDPWMYWLSGHLPMSVTAWHADRRSVIPAEPALFGTQPLDDWLGSQPADFDALLGLTEGCLPEDTCVAASTDVADRDERGTASIRSALVGPSQARALQRALQAAEDLWCWKLPLLGETEAEVDHGPFQLRGWLVAQYERESLDGLDHQARGLVWEPPLPGDEFRKWAACTVNSTRDALLNRTGRRVAWSTVWSDEDFDARHGIRRVQSSGYRTTVARQHLLGFLAATGMQLIVEVQIDLRPDRSADNRIQRSRLYLVDGTGLVSAL
ncbi:NACHT domain-containing protein [Streptomyces sp. RTGN2]|uniref:NACHT domain-containing protein n=1 Tax=Streptomyces sp. RTGN2 TaxID=3016525 RepID=UPI002554F36A|nr:NACHT domain-containing protein [Streptomyces sp. RTGN2]